MAISRAKLIVIKLMAILFGIVVGLIISEIALAWLMAPPLRYLYPQPLHITDQRLGWVMKPDQHSYTIDKPVIINHEGFRSEEIVPQKDRSNLRIICLGDSQTFGNGVAQDETYPAR